MAEDKEKKLKITKSYTKKRIRGILLISLIIFAAVIGRIIYLMNVKGETYAQKVLSQQSYLSSVIPYQRGTIYDRNGVILAISEKTYRVIIDAKVILELTDEKRRERIIKAVAETFEVDREELLRSMNEKATSSYLILKSGESVDRVASFREKAAEDSSIAGVHFEIEYNRRYPYNTLASHVIGYTNSGNAGAYGIEQYYNDELNGMDGMEYGYYDAELNSKRNVKEPEDGNSIISTIDVRIQDVLERHVREFNSETGANNIGVIAMNPRNGEILGMASNSEYDLNNPKDLSYFIGSIDESEDVSESDKELNKCYAMWRNFCVNDTYEPGSVFKTITVASALEEAAVAKNDTFICEGSTVVGGWTIFCNNKSGHGRLSLAESLMRSCNCALITIADHLGSADFLRYQKNFGFGSATGIDLPGEAEGILIKPENLNVTELATSSFGLRFNVSMVQIAAAFSSIINGGNYYTPHVAKQILNSEGNVIKNIDADVTRKTVSAETTDFIRQALFKTVTDGTGTAAQVEGYLIGGKTGTAQKLPRDSKKYVVSFIGFAPVNDPQLVIYVVLDEIHDEEKKDKSSVASSMVSSIMKEILPELSIYPSGEIEYNTSLLELLENSTEYDPLQDEKTLDVTDYPGDEGTDTNIDDTNENENENGNDDDKEDAENTDDD